MIPEIEDAKKRLKEINYNYIFRCRGCGKIISIFNRDLSSYIIGFDTYSIYDKDTRYHKCKINLDSKNIICAPILDLIGVEK